VHFYGPKNRIAQHYVDINTKNNGMGGYFFFFVVALFSLHKKKENKNDNKKNSSKAKQIPQRHTHSVVCVCGDGCSVLSIFLCFFLLFLSYFLEGQRM
jgi:hypothetical protein